MDNLDSRIITIMTFTYPHEMEIVRGLLQSEGIECFVSDELTAQANPFYSNAIGGVKLKVKESDFLAAEEILKQSGYSIKETRQTPLFNWFDKISNKIPLIGDIRWEFRLLILTGSITTILVVAAYFMTLPRTYERLTENNWCVDYITYNGKDYSPKTYAYLKFVADGSCDEYICFRNQGFVTMPGFKSRMAEGRWKLNSGNLQIFNTDTFGGIYDGIYNISFNNDYLELKSLTSTLHCRQEHLKPPF